MASSLEDDPTEDGGGSGLRTSVDKTLVAPSAQSSALPESRVVPQSSVLAPSAAPSHPGFVEEATPMFAGRYQIVSLLGSGGMGTVYLAHDRELDEVVALKVLRKETTSAPGALEMFKREVKLARRVTHPNVARTFDIGETDGQKYLTMEYVEGTSLARMIAESGRFPIGRAVEIVGSVAAGLGAAHAVDVVHRDLKPENVLIASKDGRAVITDFGVARPVESSNASVTQGMAVGTPAYMAPEQVEARRDVDQRADVYALGVMLYEILTGTLPFTGDTALAVAAARLIRPPPDVRTLRPDVPTVLAEAVMKCMARDRDERFQSVAEVVRCLSGVTMPLAAYAEPSVAVAAKALAVLPFKNAGTSEDAFIADGLVEDLIDGLSMTKGLRVRPRTSLAKHVGVDRDPVEVGREICVDVIVEGSVRRAGNKVRVSARLLNVSDGFQLWAKRFDREEKDLFALSDELASAISDGLTLQRNVPERQAPTDKLAVELYMRAKAASRTLFTSASQDIAALLEQAVARAPNDPTILAAHAVAQVRRWFFGDPSAFERARDSAERALKGAPHLHEARYALALLTLHSADYVAAIKALKPLAAEGFLGAHETLAGVLDEIGLDDEAKKQIDLALKIDPNSPFALFALSRLYAIRGQWAECDAVFSQVQTTVTESALKNEISSAGLRYLVWRGGAAEALETMRNRKVAIGPLAPSLIAALLDPTFKQNELIDRFFNAANVGSVRRRSLLHQLEAEIAMVLGHEDWALDAIVRADAARLIDINWVRKAPPLAPLRDRPRYLEVEARVAARAETLVAAYRA